MPLAADLLAGTDRRIGSVTAAVGYSSESAFGCSFRLATGSTLPGCAALRWLPRADRPPGG
jgi:transcriptional regulator GlxA family with amidase domain